MQAPAAMGFVETRGFTGVIEAIDAMNKAAKVDFVRQEQIGGGYVTALVRGDVGAVRASVEAGAQAAKAVGEFIGANVIPNLSEMIDKVVIGLEVPDGKIDPAEALGLLEFQGFTAMVAAADAAVKAARVQMVGRVYIGSGYAAAILRGDVAACRTAVNAGRSAGEQVGPAITTHVIARPHTNLGLQLPIGSTGKPEKVGGKALGIIETKGFAACVEAADRAIKSASVNPVAWQRVGSGLSTIIVQGDVAAARSAVEAGAAAASAVGQLVSTHVIARPHEALEKQPEK